MKIDLRVLGATALVGGTVLMSLVGDPSLDDRLAWRHDELENRLVSREIHVEPLELLELMHDDLVRLRIVDVRDEADFNLFHLVDAERVGCAELQSTWGDDLADDVIVVVTGNDEFRAEDAWRMLTARDTRNVYVLAGGLNRWVRDFSPARPATTGGGVSVARAAAASLLPLPTETCFADEPFVWRLPAALGDRHDVSRPDAHHLDGAEYETKVKRTIDVVRPTGGCG